MIPDFIWDVITYNVTTELIALWVMPGVFLIAWLIGLSLMFTMVGVVILAVSTIFYIIPRLILCVVFECIFRGYATAKQTLIDDLTIWRIGAVPSPYYFSRADKLEILQQRNNS